MKPTHGLVRTRGLVPACRSLDCVTMLARTVAEARVALLGHGLGRPATIRGRGRRRPVRRPASRHGCGCWPCRPVGWTSIRRTIAAWRAAVDRARSSPREVCEVDIARSSPLRKLLYQGPWIAERWAGVGELLDPDGPRPTPPSRATSSAVHDVTGARTCSGRMDRLAALAGSQATDVGRRRCDACRRCPRAPDARGGRGRPVGVNARLGTFSTSSTCSTCARSPCPGGLLADGLPFGFSVVAPAFADAALTDLAAAWCGEPLALAPVPPGWTLLAVAGAHLSGLPLNPQLVGLGGALRFRARTGTGYRLYRLNVPGVARPGLVHTGDGPADGIAVEVWQVPHHAVGVLAMRSRRRSGSAR